ncbi:MAG: hypothetical protein EXS18_04315 [Verrucomicrobiae bacterium]|nr:hypothetical protein [Verrucomicrobiae bacterium]
MVQAYMRKNQRLIWTVIAVVVVITFVFWGSMTGSGSGRQAGSPGTLYGKSISPQEYLDAQRMVHAYFTLFQRQDFTRTDKGREVLDQQTWLRLIERRKLEQWNITVTDEELVKFIQTMFTENGRFNKEKYTQFLEQQLPSMGIKDADFERLMREQLCLNELHRIIGATARVVPTEVRELYNMIHENLDLSILTFDGADYTNDVKFTDADIKEYFEKNKEGFRIPEQRHVRYVRYGSEAFTNDVKVTDAEVREMFEKTRAAYEQEGGKAMDFAIVKEGIHQEILEQKAFQRANEMATEMALEIVKPKDPTQKEVDLTKVDFDSLARKFEVQVKESDFFSMRAPVPDLKAGPDFNRAAFALTPAEPFSDAVGGADGAYVLQYLDQKPSELPALEVVKDKVVLRFTQERATDLARTKGRDAARVARNAVIAAQSSTNRVDTARVFADEAQKLGLKVLNPEPFSQSEMASEKIPDAAIVLNVAFNMRHGEVSDFVDTGRGGLFLMLKKRIPPTEAEFAREQTEFQEKVLSRKRDLVFQDWANQQIMIAKPPFLNRPQPQQGQPGQQQAPPS